VTAEQNIGQPADVLARRATPAAHDSADASIAGEASKHDATDASSGTSSRTERLRARNAYDAVAERYNQEIGDELTTKPWDRAFRTALVETSASGMIADLGCGPGHVAAYLAAQGARVLGIDLSPAMCSQARRRTIPAAAGDLAALPVASGTLSGIVCWYALIHLGADQRAAAYREMDRVLHPGGHALVAFHTSDAETASGGARRLNQWWEREVDLTFRFLDADQEATALEEAGLHVVARIDREPAPGEHQSQRSYLLVRKAASRQP
jgi:SAM-dependent methyltransferase